MRLKRVHAAGLLLLALGALGWGLAATALTHGETAPAAAPRLSAQQATPTVSPNPFGPIITAPPPGEDGAVAPPTPIPAQASPEGASPVAPTPTIEGTPLPSLNADLMGIQIDPHITEDAFNLMLGLAERLGIKWLKFQVAWDQVEPQQGVFSQTLYSYRVFAQRADFAGLNVMISIAKAPDWARNTADEDGPPRDPQLLASFINRLMSEVRVDVYGNSYFEAIEVWNEPNLRREWNGATLGGAEYMALFDAAYNAIRAGEGGHSVTVVTAGLAPTGWNDGVTAIDDRVFLRQMYAAGLNNPAYQQIAVGVHPYGAANPPDARWCGQSTCSERGYDAHPSWFFLNMLEDYRAIMEENGDGGRQLWPTEFGWGTYEGFLTAAGDPAPPPADPPYFQWVTLDDQANYTIRAFELGQSLPYVGPMILWNLNYANYELIEAGDARAAYALLMPGYVDPLRPAFKLIERALHP